MFEGFCKGTTEYLAAMTFDNTKANFERLREDYLAYVKRPLQALCAHLTPTLMQIDPSICVRPSRCVSGAFNDARFCRDEPVKTYFYLHFCQTTCREDSVPGFFMDAGREGYRYGLQLYHAAPSGMQKVREHALLNEKKTARMLEQLSHGFTEGGVVGEMYRRDHYPNVDEPLKGFLNMRRWAFIVQPARQDAFYSPQMATELETAFIKLAPMYTFLADALR